MELRVLEHPVLGDRVTVLVGPEDSAGELLRIEYAARAVTPPTDNHWHPEQEERIEVLAGTLCCRLAGEDRVLKAGETLTIPPGVPHALWNEDPSGSRSIGEYRPALDTLALFEAIFMAA